MEVSPYAATNSGCSSDLTGSHPSRNLMETLRASSCPNSDTLTHLKEKPLSGLGSGSCVGGAQVFLRVVLARVLNSLSVRSSALLISYYLFSNSATFLAYSSKGTFNLLAKATCV